MNSKNETPTIITAAILSFKQFVKLYFITCYVFVVFYVGQVISIEGSIVKLHMRILLIVVLFHIKLIVTCECLTS